MQSRLGRNQLLFKPYSEEQLIAIVINRLDGCSELFANGVLRFAAKKILMNTTDVRQWFRLLKDSLRLLKETSQEGKYFVDLDIISRAYNKQMADPMTVMLTGSRHCTKVILLCILLLQQNGEDVSL